MARVTGSGSFSIPTASTTQIDVTITWSDAGSHTPQAYLLIGRAGTAGTTRAATVLSGRGLSDGTRHFAHGEYTADNVTSSDTACRVIDTGVLVAIDNAGTATGVLGHTSFAANQISLTPSDAFAEDWHVTVYAISGASNVYVYSAALPAGTGNFSITAPGFAPDTAITIMGDRGTINSGGATSEITTGMVDALGNMACLFHRERDAQTSNYTGGVLTTGSLVARFTLTTGALDVSVTHVSWNANGATWNKVSGTATSLFAALFIGGAGADTSRIVTTAALTSVTTWGVTVSGVTPTSVLLLADNVNTSPANTSSEGTQMAFGYADANGQWAHTFVSPNLETLGGAVVTDEFSRSVTDKALIHWDRSAADTLAATGEVTLSSFAANTVTLSQTDADTTAIAIVMLVMGQTIVGTIPVIMNQYRQRSN